jgi:hypothetical protein
MRLEAQEAAKRQAVDVKAAREAAEKSAESAARLAEGMKESAEAAEKSAQAGLDSLALNKRALIISNIPSMQIYNSRLVKPLAAGEAPTMMVKLFNSGKGTAYELRLEHWFAIGPSYAFTYTPPQPLPKSPFDQAPGIGNITDMPIKLLVTLTVEQLNMVHTGRLRLYEYGRASYYDNTLEKRQKYTWYWCNYYDSVDDGSDKLLFAICPEHNYTSVE